MALRPLLSNASLRFSSSTATDTAELFLVAISVLDDDARTVREPAFAGPSSQGELPLTSHRTRADTMSWAERVSRPTSPSSSILGLLVDFEEDRLDSLLRTAIGCCFDVVGVAEESSEPAGLWRVGSLSLRMWRFGWRAGASDAVGEGVAVVGGVALMAVAVSAVPKKGNDSIGPAFRREEMDPCLT